MIKYIILAVLLSACGRYDDGAGDLYKVVRYQYQNKDK